MNASKTLDNHFYVPILRWRAAEYRSLRELFIEKKDSIFPFLEIPEAEWDFEENRWKKSLIDHVSSVEKTLKNHWPGRRCFVGFHHSIADQVLDNGEHIFEQVFSQGQHIYNFATPAINLEANQTTRRVVKRLAILHGLGVCVRVNLGKTPMKKLLRELPTLVSDLTLSDAKIDLMLDFEKPENFDVDSLAILITRLVDDIKKKFNFRSIILASSNAPVPSEFQRPGGSAPRSDWLLYKKVRISNHDLIYADYGIEPPRYLEVINEQAMRNGAARIIYTQSDNWELVKGTKYSSNSRQMIKLAAQVEALSEFKGGGFSWGDQKITDVADLDASGRKGGVGNLTTWKQVGFNHHISLVVDQLAKLNARSHNP